MKRQYLAPLHRCGCGRAACFDLVTHADVPQSYNRAAHVRTTTRKMCGKCADAISPGASDVTFVKNDMHVIGVMETPAPIITVQEVPS